MKSCYVAVSLHSEYDIMTEIGRVNTLKIVRESDFGLYLDGGEELGDILLPNRYVPKEYQIGDELEVFVSQDSQHRPFACTERPYAQVDEFAYLEVVSCTRFGAFLDWGLDKDLFIPFKEQKVRLEQGDWCVVYIYFDEVSKRLVASSKIAKFLYVDDHDYQKGEQVRLMIASKTDLGYNVIVDDDCFAVLHNSDVFKPVAVGERMVGYIKNVREDRKIDVCLTVQGKSAVDEVADKILKLLSENEGFITINDKSPADTINGIFGHSKKVFKKAVGLLYKQKQIEIVEGGIKKV